MNVNFIKDSSQCLRNNKTLYFPAISTYREGMKRSIMLWLIWFWLLLYFFLSITETWDILHPGTHPYSYGRAFYFTVEEKAGTKTSEKSNYLSQFMKHKCKWRIFMPYPPKNNESTQLKDLKVAPHRHTEDIVIFQIIYTNINTQSKELDVLLQQSNRT